MKKFGMTKWIIMTMCAICIICTAILIANADRIEEPRADYITAWDEAYDWSQEYYYDEQIRYGYEENGVWYYISSLDREELCKEMRCSLSDFRAAMTGDKVGKRMREDYDGAEDVCTVGFYQETTENNVEIYTMYVVSDETDLLPYEDGINNMVMIIVGVY